MADQSQSRPFNGLRVVALEQAVSAPFCTRQFADLGADVIKIERPDGGDFSRAYDADLRGVSSHFAWLNRGKRSIALDLKQPRDHEVMVKLLERADVFVHNLSPGAVERLGFGYESLSATHSRLIWCGISGYGPDGPYRDKKAYDLLVQAESGVVSLTGSADAAAKVGISIADIASGFYAYSSILAALFHRERSGAGDRIDISMLECLTEWATPALYMWLGTGRVPSRVGIRHNSIVPYGAYACGNGSVNFAIQNQREWRRLCDSVVQDPSITDDPRFATNADRLKNRAELEPLIERIFASLTVEQVVARLEAADIASAVVNDIPAVAAHPQLASRNRWVEVDSLMGPLPALLPPHNLAGVLPLMGRVPDIGEHTAEILAELGMKEV